MQNFKKIGAVLLTFALALSMGIGVFAANPALIDESIPGSIKIHKFDDTGTDTGLGTPADGTEIADTSDFGAPLNGITFRITYLEDATAATTVLEAQTMVDEMELAGTLAENQKTGVTVNGVYEFANLTLGIYLVEELSIGGISSPVAPFLVSVPMTNPKDQASWMYNIHVYPKNTVITPATISKVVIDANGDPAATTHADIGSAVTWDITVSIPAYVSKIDATNSDEGYFFVTDTLDTRLNYGDVTVKLINPDGSVKRDLAATEYILEVPAATGGGVIKVDFKTEDGIKALGEADIGSTVRITVTTTINASAVTNLATAITNTASLYFNNEDGDPSDPVDPVMPPTTPEVKVTGLALYKYYKDASDIAQPLNNAVFTIYASATDVDTGTAIEKNGVDWTEKTGADAYGNGYIYFSSADIEAATGETLDGTETFYLVETVTPTGYELLNEVIPVALGTTGTVENVKISGGFTLPITGGAGTILFAIIGIVLVGGAITLLVIYRKRKRLGAK